MTDIPANLLLETPPGASIELPLPADLSQPPTSIPGFSEKDLGELRAQWPDFSLREREWMWRLIQKASAAEQQANALREQQQRRTQARKNHKAIHLLREWAADESGTAEEATALTALQEAYPADFP